MEKLMGARKKVVSVGSFNKETESIFGKKTKRILLILAIELVLAILIFSIIQIFK
jgi:hypothetical protein